ncbi:polysaccharide deacetylase family protein [Paenibacillus sp. GCM10012303]|uniref:polysaccharide deacetylase family protein n=1 Tax=Paenibacillus sp. GCM10012303 TaxID=3317340 RepID=UPI003612AECF
MSFQRMNPAFVHIDDKEIRKKFNEFKNRGMNARGRSTTRIPRAMVTFGTDDGAITDKTHLLPITRATGIGMVNAVIPTRVQAGNHLTLADLQTMQAEGWEITSHTWSHADLITLTDAESEEEIRKAAEWIEVNGFNGRTLCIPYGHYGDREKLIAQKYHRAVRVSNTDAKLTINKPPIPTFELKSLWFSNLTTIDAAAGFPLNSFERYKWWIDKVVAEGGWLILFTHGWEIAEWGASQLLTDVINYAKTVADIVTFNEGLDRMDNVIESGLFSNNFERGYDPHFVMSMDGKIRSNYQLITKIKKNEIKSTMLPMDFENQTITLCNVDSTQTGWPMLPGGYKAGVLTTYAIQPIGATWDIGYYWQEFKPYGTVSSTRFIRSAKDGENLWHPWTRWDPSVTINARINSYTAATLPNELPVGFRIQTAVNSANSAGMPAAATGLFIIDTTGLLNSSPTDFGFVYQEYHRYATNEVWRRVATNGTTWSAWQKLNYVST